MRSIRTSIGLWISWYLRRIIFISARVIGYRVEILATNRDTCNYTELPTMYDLIDDVLVAGVDEEDDYYLYLPVTDNYFSDYPFACHMVKEDGKTILSSIDAIDGLQ